MLRLQGGLRVASHSCDTQGMKNSFIAEAIDAAGGVTTVAQQLKITRRMVHYWSAGKIALPFWAAAALEILTDGAVTRQQLCPEYFAPLKTLDYYVAAGPKTRRAA